MALSVASSLRCRARPQRLHASTAPRASAAAQSAGAAVPVGSRVRVKDSITVYHVPKQKTGLALSGMEGVVEKHADVAPDGKSLLSATQPLVVRFEMDAADGKKVAFTTHLTPSEVEVLGTAPAAASGAAAAAGAKAGGAPAGAAAGGPYAKHLAEGEVFEVTSEEEFDAALASTDKLVILDAGASWCGPCKVFKPTFIAAAKVHAGKALFLSCVGDANGSTAKIMKRLAIKAVPSFVGFKSGENVFQYSGAKKELLEEKLAAHV